MEIGEADGPAPYGDVLRAVGAQLDAHGWGMVRLDARAAHLVLVARSVRQGGAAERLVLPPGALRQLLHTARTRRRGRADGGRGIARRAGIGYADALRLVGQDLERHGARLVRVIEHTDGLIVQAFPPGAGLTTVLVSWAALAALHRYAVRQRRP